MILIKNTLAYLKKIEDEELGELLYEDSCQAQAKLIESLKVDHTIVSKRLRALERIQKQRY